MNIKQFATENSITIAKVRELCLSAFGNIPETLTENQINRLKADLNAPVEAAQSKQITGFQKDSSSIRKRPQSTGAIALPEDYQKLYSLVPVEFQKQLDKLPECDRVSVLLAAVEGIELAEMQHLTKEAFINARLNQLENNANSSRLNQQQQRSKKRDDFSDFDTEAFIQKLEAEELLKAMLGGQ